MDGRSKISVRRPTLETVRESLIRQEDTIIFSLIERAKYPYNATVYEESSSKFPGLSGSLIKVLVKETEILQAKVGRYASPEEHPFFPNDLPVSMSQPQAYCEVLHPIADSININENIWDVYFNEILPLITSKGDDGNYVPTASADLACLQALSRRIHYGKFVAEVKFSEAPQDYGAAIQAQDRDALMKLLTFKNVEEMVKRRVEKKAAKFGQEVTLNETGDIGKLKIDPLLVSRLYDEWVMPLTKLVEVKYLLHRLD